MAFLPLVLEPLCARFDVAELDHGVLASGASTFSGTDCRKVDISREILDDFLGLSLLL